jgi:cytosine/adenosine deaminase-related metal-dependent hydrolase
MLEVAFVTALAAHMTGEEEIQAAFDFPRSHAARILGLKGHSLKPGNPASFVLLPVRSASEALSAKPERKIVVRKGQVVPLEAP